LRQIAELKEKITLSVTRSGPCEAERLLRIQTLAEDTFADKEKAHRWLRHPLAELLGEAPLTIAQTEAGAKAVEAILGKIAWGATA
jgi:putative toxin-antitoxin system antitoxin component (TIGR02293 family)